jgi:hypothetical protein
VLPPPPRIPLPCVPYLKKDPPPIPPPNVWGLFPIVLFPIPIDVPVFPIFPPKLLIVEVPPNPMDGSLPCLKALPKFLYYVLKFIFPSFRWI